MSPKWYRQVGFRARMALSITGIFVVAGLCLVLVEFLLVSQLLNRAIGTTSSGLTATTDLVVGYQEALPAQPMMEFSLAAPIETLATETVPAAGQPMEGSAVVITSIDGEAVGAWYQDTSAVLADDVMVGLLVWSGLALVGFAGLAAAAAWWVSKRSVRRIGEVTAMAQDLSHHDLSRRLDLRGPHDEIKDLADTFDAMLDRLQDSFERQERFVANASHELRTPLTTARTALEIPLAQGRVPAELQADVRVALRAGERSADLLAALLTLARSRRPEVLETHDIADVVTDVVEEVRGSTTDRVWTVETAPVDAVVDPVLVGQAVTNLVANAVRYNVSGGLVRVVVGGQDGGAVVRVVNDGPVVDPAEVDRLVEPFVRAGTARTGGAGGSGLGLSIVEAVAQAHGGSLHLRARPEGGLDVSLWLPGQPIGPEPRIAFAGATA